MVEIKKASVWKRVSAGLFDLIMLAVVGILCVLILSAILGYDGKLAEYNSIRTSIEEEYGVTYPVKESEYQTYDEETKARYDAAVVALKENGEASRLFSLYFLLTNFILLEITFGLLLAVLILEFTVPLLFKNGQTLGKKIFGICVIRNDTVKVSGPVLFIRTVLGKYAVEIMLPVFSAVMILTGQGSIIFLIIALLVPLINLVMFFVTKKHTVLHDLMALTVTADLATQRIFESKEALVEYQKKQAEEEANASRDEAYYFRR